MPNESNRAIDAVVAELRRKFRPLYRKAEEDLKRELEAYVAQRSDELEAAHKSLEKEEISKAEYARTVRTILMTGAAWLALRKRLAERMYQANAASVQIANAALPSVYADAASRTAYQLEKQAGQQVGLLPCTGEDVEALGVDLPTKRVNKQKDTRWNAKRITSAMLAGAALGYGAGMIGRYVSRSVTGGGLNAMTDAAENMVGGTYATGQYDAMEDADACGLESEKTWISTLDHKTRETHQELDGQTIPKDQPFVTVNGELMFPRDPDGPIEETANCRCAMTVHAKEFKLPSIRRENMKDENNVKPIVNATTYREWKAMKEEQAGGAEALAEQWAELRRQERRARNG